MNKKQKKTLERILIAVALVIVLKLLPALPMPVELALYCIPYLVVGWDVLRKALKGIKNRQPFDECFLMAVATVGAFALGDYVEGCAVIIFYQIGELFQSVAVGKSRQSIASLMDIRPDYANVERNGKLVQVDPDEVAVGEIITVKPGERVPIDGEIISGRSALDTSALTGESLPREVEEGMEVISGCINQTGILKIKTTKEFGESTVAKILDLVENSSEKKARSENFITRFAKFYTPIVVFAALLLATIPPYVLNEPFSGWIYRALTFLVISCPCALVISIPLSFFGGIGGASKCVVLVKGSNYLEALADTETVVFDKTGTLTKGSFAVTSIKPVGMTKAELLELAAYAEDYSNHPISLSIKRAYGKDIKHGMVKNIEEIAGHGVRAVIGGQTVLCGNGKLMQREKINYTPCAEAGTVIYAAVDGKFAGYILIEDEVKADAAAAIKMLKTCGVRETVMLTGDSDAVGQKIAKRLGLDRAFTQLLPADKVEHVERLLEALHKRSNRGKLAFVGDGINDAPVLARADVGIAMGALGSDAAIEAADIVLMTDEPSKIASAIKIARKTLGIVRQNIIFAIGIKIAVLALGALGYASMWAAVFADVGVSVIAILNAVRALNVSKYKNEQERVLAAQNTIHAAAEAT